MTVQTPVELAYYYECSYGDFRLTYQEIRLHTTSIDDKVAATIHDRSQYSTST